MKTVTTVSLLLLLGFLAIYSCTEEAATPPPTEPANAEATEADLVKRGEYLVTILGCDDCHSPKTMTEQGPVPDMARRLSGHPADEKLPAITDKGMIAPGQWALFTSGLTASVGPWGTSFAANLTPDDTGIGAWSLEQFSKAVREGKSKGMDNGRMLLPPMPWPNYRNMTDEDLSAVFAFMKTLKPVKNLVSAPIPPGGAQ